MEECVKRSFEIFTSHIGRHLDYSKMLKDTKVAPSIPLYYLLKNQGSGKIWLLAAGQPWTFLFILRFCSFS